jgi:ATP-dependent Clp protease ATP-binding subunit ClpA
MLKLPREDLEKQDILSKIVGTQWCTPKNIQENIFTKGKKFEEDKNYSEQEVDKIIQSFVVDDFILFRRELINFNYLGKDSYKGIYWLKTKKLSKELLEKISINSAKLNKY